MDSQMMTAISNQELISRAEAVLHPRTVRGRLLGDVACALVTDAGNVYAGVCIDTGSGTGFCAEHSAVAAMVTAGELNIAKIVAVWKDERGATVVLPPCGRCREFVRQIDEGNLETEVILGTEHVARLKDLLPYHEWPAS